MISSATMKNTDMLPQHPVPTTQVSFDSLGLCETILRTIKKIGFQHPTPVQEKVIPIALKKEDLIGLAQTGSGKTAAFCLPLAERLTHGGELRGLILCPTREIALQTKAFLDLFGEFHHLKTVCLIGGVKISPQFHALKQRPDIVVATPGRLVDHMERKSIRLDKIRELVLDEADHMLDMGFWPQIRKILAALPRERHTMMFSATMPEQIRALARQFLKNPVHIDITPKGKAAHGITHRLYLVESKDKKHCILSLLHQELGRTLVFIRRKIDVEWLFHILEKEGHAISRIHSDRSQSQRVTALEDFRKGKVRVLVATDIAARGIDVAGIEHIINYNPPETVDDYIHRAGRTARYKAEGMVSTIATWMDRDMIRNIENALKKDLPRCTLPGIEPYKETHSKPFVRKGRGGRGGKSRRGLRR